MADTAMSPAPGAGTHHEFVSAERRLPRDADQQYQLGNHYCSEEHRDWELALFWLGRAARQGHAGAMFELARLIEQGHGPVRNPAQASTWYRKAAAAGHAGAAEAAASLPPTTPGQLEMAIGGDARSQYQMGFAHMMGTGAPKDYIQSYFWFKVLSKTMPAQAAMTLKMVEQRLDPGTPAMIDALAAEWTPGNPPPESPYVLEARANARLDDARSCAILGRVLSVRLPDAQAEGLEWLSWAANQGFPPAHYRLAFHYRSLSDAQEVERHMALAGDALVSPEILEEGVALGINHCRVRLGWMLAKDPDVEENPERTVSLYRAAAEEGHVPAFFQLGACYSAGYGVERDLAQAEHWYSEGAKHDDPQALYGMGAIYRNRAIRASRSGTVTPEALRDHEEATRFFSRATVKGHVEATYQLSLACRFGQGIAKDGRRAREFTLLAADRGHAESQYLYANYCARGDGDDFPQDDANAVYWYDLAASQQHPAATYRLGVHIMYGRGVEQDYQKGHELVEQAAQMGSDDAMLMLGAIIETGESRVKDPQVALAWYQKAAEKGNAEAQFRLGDRLVKTEGVAAGRPYLEQAAAQGHQEAREMIEMLDRTQAAQAQRVKEEKAQWNAEPAAMAISGDANAQFQLGFSHFSGVGAARSLPLSYFWLKVVERAMPMAVGQMLQVVGGQLGGQKEELDRLAAAWTPGTPPPQL